MAVELAELDPRVFWECFLATGTPRGLGT